MDNENDFVKSKNSNHLLQLSSLKVKIKQKNGLY
jgi:hypothetical protein